MAEEVLRELLASGQLQGELIGPGVVKDVVITDGSAKTFHVRDKIAAVPRARFDNARKAWRCRATPALRAAIDEARTRHKADTPGIQAVIERQIERRIERAKWSIYTRERTLARDHALQRCNYEYTRSLLYSAAVLGKDGAPNWPAPP